MSAEPALVGPDDAYRNPIGVGDSLGQRLVEQTQSPPDVAERLPFWKRERQLRGRNVSSPF